MDKKCQSAGMPVAEEFVAIDANMGSDFSVPFGGRCITTETLKLTTEHLFRAALALVILLFIPVGVYFRRKAAASGERISHKDEGYLFAAVLRLCGLLLWISVLVYLVRPASIAWATMPLPELLRWCGIALAFSGAGLMYWTLKNLGGNLTDTVVTRSNATLVTQGPYRWVRHPFYMTAALTMVAVTLLSANACIGVCSALVMSFLVVRTSKEEQRLIDKFGQAYLDYSAKTGRFFPRLRP